MAVHLALQTVGVREVNVAWGTKAGKTVYAATWLGGAPPSPLTETTGVWRWAAPVVKQTAIGIRRCIECFGFLPGVEYRKGDAVLEFPKRRTRQQAPFIEFRTANDPDNLAGEGLVKVVLDEAARMKEYAFDVTRTNLTATRGQVLRIGTPKGRNRFYREFNRGLDPTIGHTRSFQCPTSVNPFIPEEEIELARNDIPEPMFRQEYGAEFVDDVDVVFPGFRSCVKAGTLSPPKADHRYVAGLDLGRSTTRTVLAIFDQSVTPYPLVYLDRFFKMPWEMIEGRVMKALSKYGADCLVDATGPGDRVFSALRRAVKGARVSPFVYSVRSKQPLVENLQIMIEKGEVALADDKVLIAEFDGFTYEYNHRNRSIHYGPSSGGTDDIVDAVCLAAHKLARAPLVAVNAGRIF